MTEPSERPIRVTQYGGTEGDFRLTGLRPGEIDNLQSCAGGHTWVRVVGGRLETVPAHLPLPEPTEDESMLPFWIPSGAGLPYQLELFHHLELGGSKAHTQFSITIQHLCGYSYTPNAYKWCADRLGSYGFECLRSRRDVDGKFSEIWFLPSLFFAAGDLKLVLLEIPREDSAQQLQAALGFLSRNVSFGTLDVSFQRLAQVLD